MIIPTEYRGREKNQHPLRFKSRDKPVLTLVAMSLILIFKNLIDCSLSVTKMKNRHRTISQVAVVKKNHHAFKKNHHWNLKSAIIATGHILMMVEKKKKPPPLQKKSPQLWISISG
ncbi:hypothetical protein [Pareuzebyella sediminis]|uniref:hypothetical protein n=1 Tax=Pareuzebyella sediminis TaxID=2607998 RepID=UPI0011ED482A|nr:hypothetical protein [Pareuzebyella sediminis]